MVGYDWATEPLSRITTHSLNVQQLYGELESALSLHREARLATVHDSVTMRLNMANERELPDIFYQGQGCYLNQHKYLRNRPPPLKKQAEKDKKFDPLKII